PIELSKENSTINVCLFKVRFRNSTKGNQSLLPFAISQSKIKIRSFVIFNADTLNLQTLDDCIHSRFDVVKTHSIRFRIPLLWLVLTSDRQRQQLLLCIPIAIGIIRLAKLE